MKKIMCMVLVVFAVLLLAAVSPAAASGEYNGYIKVSCNVDGAYVELITVNGDVADSEYCYGSTTFDVPTTGTPITEVRASKSGYYGDSSSVTMPAAGEIVSVSLSLTPISPTSVGGDKGYIQVSCNADGAYVELLSSSGSVIDSGYCYGSTTFSVYTTGTPVTQVRATKNGYYSATTPVSMPGAGQTTYASLSLTPISPTSVGGDKGYIQVSCNVNGAYIELLSSSGAVLDSGTCYGSTTFSVYTTSTPVTQVRATKSGYYSATTPVSMPGKGQTNYASLSMTPISSPGPVGSDTGYIQVSCNVDGAFIELLSASGSVLDSGYAYGPTSFTVYTTATPVTEVRASSPGFYTETASVSMPGAGQTSSVSITLSMLPGPIPTKSPMGLAVLGLLGVVALAVILRRD